MFGRDGADVASRSFEFSRAERETRKKLLFRPCSCPDRGRPGAASPSQASNVLVSWPGGVLLGRARRPSNAGNRRAVSDSSVAGHTAVLGPWHLAKGASNAAVTAQQ